MNGCRLNLDFKPEGNKHTLNRWIVTELAAASVKAADALKAFKYNEAASALYQFTWGTFCDWYIEFTKPLINGSDEAVKKETQDTTGWVLDQILLLLNPFMPYLTEELHAHLLGKEKLTQEDWLQTKMWPEFDKKVIDVAAQDEVNWVVKLISEIRSVRTDLEVPAAAFVDLKIKEAAPKAVERLERYQEIIKRLARIGNYVNVAQVETGDMQVMISDATVSLPLSNVIDLAQARQRLNKDIEKANANIERINKMLLNKAFLAKAPEEVVQEQTEARTEAENLKTKLMQALKQIEGK
jgi:valyl-tRNA synthetase